MRQRMIKPEFFVDDRLLECSLSARLAFISTWCIADDQGNLERSTKQIRRLAFPDETNENVDSWVSELITQGLLLEYSTNEGKFLHIKGFAKHQRIDKPSKPRCPSYESRIVLQDGSESTPAQVKLNEVKLNEENQTKENPPPPQSEPKREEGRADFFDSLRDTPDLERFLDYVQGNASMVAHGLSESQWTDIWRKADATEWTTLGNGRPEKIQNWKLWADRQARTEKSKPREKQASEYYNPFNYTKSTPA